MKTWQWVELENSAQFWCLYAPVYAVGYLQPQLFIVSHTVLISNMLLPCPSNSTAVPPGPVPIGHRLEPYIQPVRLSNVESPLPVGLHFPHLFFIALFFLVNRLKVKKLLIKKIYHIRKSKHSVPPVQALIKSFMLYKNPLYLRRSPGQLMVKVVYNQLNITIIIKYNSLLFLDGFSLSFSACSQC